MLFLFQRKRPPVAAAPSPAPALDLPKGLLRPESAASLLATPRRQFDENGRVKVESKKDLAKPNRPGGPRPSPNIADAMIMCYAPGENTIETWAKLAQ